MRRARTVERQVPFRQGQAGGIAHQHAGDAGTTPGGQHINANLAHNRRIVAQANHSDRVCECGALPRCGCVRCLRSALIDRVCGKHQHIRAGHAKAQRVRVAFIPAEALKLFSGQQLHAQAGYARLRVLRVDLKGTGGGVCLPADGALARDFGKQRRLQLGRVNAAHHTHTGHSALDLLRLHALGYDRVQQGAAGRVVDARAADLLGVGGEQFVELAQLRVIAQPVRLVTEHVVDGLVQHARMLGAENADTRVVGDAQLPDVVVAAACGTHLLGGRLHGGEQRQALGVRVVA